MIKPDPKTHYQAFYVDIKKEKQSLCNAYLRAPQTTTDLERVDCLRCRVLAKKYKRAYNPFYRMLIEIKWALYRLIG